MLVLFFWGRSPISPQRRKERRKSFHLRFLFLMRLWNLLMYKKKWYLFSFTDTSWRDPLFLPVWSPGCQICLSPLCLEVRATFSEGHGLLRWLGQVSTQFKAPLFLRTSSWGNIYAGNLLWSLPASLWISHPPTVSIHMCSLALGWVSGALLAGQTHGAHESSQCEISSLDHVMETLRQHCKRISTSHRCSEEPSECGNHLTVLWKQTIPSLCQSLIHAMIPQMTSPYKIFLTQWNVCFSKLYFKLSI